MNTLKTVALSAITLTSIALGHPAGAQPLSGVKVGATVARQVDNVDQLMPGTAGRFDRQNDDLGYRGFVGYDAVVADRFLLGAEAGLGNGGATLTQRFGAAGVAKADPGLTWDVSAKAGVLVTPRAAIYGRLGYAHADFDRSLKATPTAAKVRFGGSEGGLQYGVGGEYAVSDHVSLRGEFVRTDFAKHIRRDELRFGAAYRF